MGHAAFQLHDSTEELTISLARNIKASNCAGASSLRASEGALESATSFIFQNNSSGCEAFSTKELCMTMEKMQR